MGSKIGVGLLVLAAFVLSAQATWTVTTDDSNPIVTDGHWTIKLYNKSKAAFVSTDGTTTILDMSTLNSDLEAAGKTYKCTAIDSSGFRGQNVSAIKTALTQVIFPDELATIMESSFQGCEGLTSVELGAGFQGFSSHHAFAGCKALETIYTRGETPVTGTIHLPDCVASLPNYTFESCQKMKHLIARGAKTIGQGTFYDCAIVESIELSPELYSVTSGGDQGPLYKDWKLTSFYPSNMVLTADIGQSCFREIPLSHGLDFSESTFTYIAANAFFGIALPNDCKITLPATVNSLGQNAFRQQQNSKTYYVNIRFLGEVPTTLSSDCLTPRNSGTHNVLYVDAKKCPTWTASGFTSIEDDSTLASQASYPGEKTLGISTIGVNQSGWWNWLVQEDLPKGPTYWEVTGTDGSGVVTITSTNNYWSLSLTPNGSGSYLVGCLAANAPAAEELDLGKIEDDTDLPVAGLAEGAFANVSKLSDVTIPAGANALGAHAFSNCTALVKVTLPTTFSWNDAGVGAFEDCSALTTLGLSSQTATAGKLVLPDGATALADSLFAGCTQFTTFSAPGLTSVGARVFDGCTSLATATFSVDLGALTSIGEAAFRGTALTQTMDFTNTPMTAIPASIFENCTGVSLVKLPATVTTVGAAAFKNMAPGANVSFAGNPPTFGADALLPSASTAGSRYIIRVENESNLNAWKATGFTATTPEMQEESDYLGNSYQGWTTLGASSASNWLFFLDPNLTWWVSGRSTYTRPNNGGTVQTMVVTDGDWEMHVFTVSGVTNIAPKLCVAGGTLDMTTLNSDTELYPSVVQESAFFGSSAASPAVVRLPDSVTTLGKKCFQENPTITEIEVGANFASLGPGAPFRDANSFGTFYKRGVSERVEGLVCIPAEVTELPESCFYNCDGVYEVLATNVVSVGHSSFFNEGNVTNIVLSPDVHTIGNGGNGVFYQCGNLRTISPSAMKLTTLGSDAFRELRLKHGLDFSLSTFTWIGTRAFFGFKANGEDGETHYPVIFPKTVATVNEKCFYGYSGWNQVYVFLGDKPTFPVSNTLDPQGNAGRRYFLVVDAEKYPAWIESDFTAVSVDDKSLEDYPPTYLKGTPGYPGGDVLGWLTTSAGDYKNWLIQYKRVGLVLFVR